MEKRACGEIRVHERRDGQLTYSLRFRINGKRTPLTLGKDTDGWTYRKAERKLEQVLAEVTAGVWSPPPSHDEVDKQDVTFHEMGPPSQCSRRHLRRPTASPTAGGSRLHSSVRPASHKAPGGISWRVKGAEANGSRLH
jgi:hypothetical protein